MSSFYAGLTKRRELFPDNTIRQPFRRVER